MRNALLLMGFLLLLSSCGNKGDSEKHTADFNSYPVPELDSLPEVAFTTLDTVLHERSSRGDTLPISANELFVSLPATLIGFAEPEVTDAQDLNGPEGHLSMAQALFFDENDNYMELKLYDLNAMQALVRSTVEEYRSADGTTLNGAHFTRLPVMPKGRIGYLRREDDVYRATVLSGYRYQLVVETDAPCEADCFLQVVNAVKWEKLR